MLETGGVDRAAIEGPETLESVADNLAAMRYLHDSDSSGAPSVDVVTDNRASRGHPRASAVACVCRGAMS